jgi:hypothetical protein
MGPVHQHLVQKFNLNFDLNKHHYQEINNGKFQKSPPQMKKSEEHQQIGLNH